MTRVRSAGSRKLSAGLASCAAVALALAVAPPARADEASGGKPQSGARQQAPSDSRGLLHESLRRGERSAFDDAPIVPPIEPGVAPDGGGGASVARPRGSVDRSHGYGPYGYGPGAHGRGSVGSFDAVPIVPPFGSAAPLRQPLRGPKVVTFLKRGGDFDPTRDVAISGAGSEGASHGGPKVILLRQHDGPFDPDKDVIVIRP